MSVFYFLPESLGDQLLPFLEKVMPTVIRGLADETEPVRDIAFKASQMIVQQYTHSALDTLLNILEKSLFDDNWRIRQSSILILGNILHIVSNAGAQDESQRKGTDISGLQQKCLFVGWFASSSLPLSPSLSLSLILTLLDVQIFL
jgi:hypothetical protein